MSLTCSLHLPREVVAIGMALSLAAQASTPQLDFYYAEFVGQTPVNVQFVNPVVGWDAFFNSGFRGGSSVIGNLEAGTAWFDHEVFIRTPGAPAAFTTWNNPAAGAVNQIDFHATTVVHVLAGSGYIPDNSGSYTYTGLGMAPEARVVSGGVATGFSTTDLGGFSTSSESVITAYRDFFQGNSLGAGISKLDVINSSWGGDGDTTASSLESLSIDGLARQNADVALVVSAGNSGNGEQTGSPANGFNNISVGSTGGAGFLTPSLFSSSGLADFYNPMENGGTLHTGVRAVVDIAAPGENLYLAAYLGDSGGIGAARPDLVQGTLTTDLYFIESSGTSYSAPIVAGGIALLKDLARTGLSETPEANPASFDTRVIKSVLMAGSTATNGWDNGQNQFNVTTQALDTATGAGMLNLVDAADVYLGATRGLAVGVGREVSNSGWNMTTISESQPTIDYVIDTPFSVATTLTVALNWFAVRGFDDIGMGQDIAFANLNLQVWELDDLGQFMSMVGESRTLYNNTEFLRLEALDPGQYAMRVLFDDMIFDTTGSIDTETYALAWNSIAIPEPGVTMLGICSVVILLLRRKRGSVK